MGRTGGVDAGGNTGTLAILFPPAADGSKIIRVLAAVLATAVISTRPSAPTATPSGLAFTDTRFEITPETGLITSSVPDVYAVTYSRVAVARQGG